MEYYVRENLNHLQLAIGGVELNDAERLTLEWLAGYEGSSIKNICTIIYKARNAERSRTPGLTKKELLTVWGYLQSLKDIYEGKAREAATRPDALGTQLAGDWMKMVAEITPLQEKINQEAEQCE